MDKKFIAALEHICLSNESAALVTVINVKGSTPRKPGAKMLVTLDGQVYGTIGGGCGEADVRREALNALSMLKSTKYTVNMTGDIAEEEGMVCGGIMEVLIDVIQTDAVEEKKFFNNYLQALKNNEDPLLVSLTDGSEENLLGKKVFITKSGTHFGDHDVPQLEPCMLKEIRENRTNKLIKANGFSFFVEPAPKLVELLVLGGGHIALPLVKMAKLLNYHVTVVDDRPSFANKDRFAEANSVICDDFVRAIKTLEITTNTYVVIVTRGHRHDKMCLQQIINEQAGYIGMIGSRRRVKALVSELLEEGIPLQSLQKVYSPIGLNIKAETPEEVAVSIIAEIVSVNRGGMSQSLKLT